MLATFADSAGMAFIMVATTFKLIEANALGHKLLREGDPFCLRGGIVQATNPTLTLFLAKAQEMRAPQSIAVRSQADGDPTSVQIFPYEDHWCLLARTIGGDLPKTPVDVSSIYGLSKAEWRVCQLLAQGLSAKEIAETCDISIETVRTHRKRVYAKTGTNGRPELMLLIAQYRI
jgi:DNA-binding CsgD family transcriptional regulator